MSEVNCRRVSYQDLRQFDLHAIWRRESSGRVEAVKKKYQRIFDSLDEDFEDIKCLWEVSVYYGAPYPIGDRLQNSSVRLDELDERHVFLAYLFSAIRCVKVLRKKSRIKDIDDEGVLVGIVSRHLSVCLARIREIAKNNLLQGLILGSFHPFLRVMLEVGDTAELIKICELADLKRAEVLFIRSANSEKKRIRDFLSSSLNYKKKLSIARFDLSVDSRCQTSANSPDFIGAPQGVSVKYCRSEIAKIVEKIKMHLQGEEIFAVEVIHPFAVLRGIRFHEVIGHLVIACSARRHEALHSLLYSSFALEIFGLRLEPSGPQYMGVKALAVGTVKYLTPEHHRWMEQIANFLTVERRLVKPPKVSQLVKDVAPQTLRLTSC